MAVQKVKQSCVLPAEIEDNLARVIATAGDLLDPSRRGQSGNPQRQLALPRIHHPASKFLPVGHEDLLCRFVSRVKASRDPNPTDRVPIAATLGAPGTGKSEAMRFLQSLVVLCARSEDGLQLSEDDRLLLAGLTVVNVSFNNRSPFIFPSEGKTTAMAEDERANLVLDQLCRRVVCDYYLDVPWAQFEAAWKKEMPSSHNNLSRLHAILDAIYADQENLKRPGGSPRVHVVVTVDELGMSRDATAVISALTSYADKIPRTRCMLLVFTALNVRFLAGGPVVRTGTWRLIDFWPLVGAQRIAESRRFLEQTIRDVHLLPDTSVQQLVEFALALTNGHWRSVECILKSMDSSRVTAEAVGDGWVESLKAATPLTSSLQSILPWLLALTVVAPAQHSSLRLHAKLSLDDEPTAVLNLARARMTGALVNEAQLDPDMFAPQVSIPLLLNYAERSQTPLAAALHDLLRGDRRLMSVAWERFERRLLPPWLQLRIESLRQLDNVRATSSFWDGEEQVERETFLVRGSIVPLFGADCSLLGLVGAVPGTAATAAEVPRVRIPRQSRILLIEESIYSETWTVTDEAGVAVADWEPIEGDIVISLNSTQAATEGILFVLRASGERLLPVLYQAKHSALTTAQAVISKGVVDKAIKNLRARFKKLTKGPLFSFEEKDLVLVFYGWNRRMNVASVNDTTATFAGTILAAGTIDQPALFGATFSALLSRSVDQTIPGS